MHPQRFPDFGYNLSLHTEHIGPALLPEPGLQDIGVLYEFQLLRPGHGQDRPWVTASYLHTEGRQHHEDLAKAHGLSAAHKAGSLFIDGCQRTVGANTTWSPRIGQLCIHAWVGEHNQDDVVRVNPSPELLRARAVLLLTAARLSLQAIGDTAKDAVINADMWYWYLRSPLGKTAFERVVVPDYEGLYRQLLPDVERVETP